MAWLVPRGCDIRGDPALFRWACLLPGLMAPASLGAAVLLPMAAMLNRRAGRPMPDGWPATILLSGAAAQIAFTVGYVFALDAAYLRLFLAEPPVVPQPFVAGAIAGGVIVAALRIDRGRH